MSIYRKVYPLGGRKRSKQTVPVLVWIPYIYIPSSEVVAKRVLDVHNVEGSRVLLAVNNLSDTSNVVSASDHAQVSCNIMQNFKYWQTLPYNGKQPTEITSQLTHQPPKLQKRSEHSPDSNLMKSRILPVSQSTWIVSLTLIRGSGYRMVRPSLVVTYGTPLGPVTWVRTLHSLYYNINNQVNNVPSTFWYRDPAPKMPQIQGTPTG